MTKAVVSSDDKIRKAFDVLVVTNQLERTPGFGHAVGFSSRHLSPQDFDYNDEHETLTVRMTLTASLLWKDENAINNNTKSGVKPGMLSTFAAIVDEATTLALLLDERSEGRPGVTVILAMQAGPALHNLREGREIQVISRVQRAGRNLAFLQACVSNGVQVDFFAYPMHPHNVRGKDRVHLMEKVLNYIIDNNQ